jgi:hypothetical protein
VGERPSVPRVVIFFFALAVLFETWIWGSMTAVMRRVVVLIPWTALKQALVRLVDWLPVWAVVIFFGVPFGLVELGSLGCVVLAATGHIVMGGVAYVLLKCVGLALTAAIFDLSRQKLLTLPWFAYLYDKLVVLHAYAHGLVEPYRAAAVARLGQLRARTRAYLARRFTGAEEEAR